jgi:Peptidase inhibitor family I36
MAKFLSRSTAFVVAILLITALPRTALASAPWSAGCSGGTGSNYVCIYSDWHWEGNFGHTTSSDLSYVGETYPSSTYAVNDSVSSNKNLWSGLDVKWYVGANYSGDYLCSNSGQGWYYVGVLWNDAFSSHNVVSGAACS